MILRKKHFFFLLIACCAYALWGASAVRAAGSGACDMAPPTRINVLPETAEITYDYSQRLAKIQEAQIDTVDPYGIHSNSITQGFMEGQISMKREVEMDYKVVNGGRDVCLWYKTINVHIHIDPKIVIAKEVKSDRCMYDAVLEHEHKHIDVDREIVDAAAQEIGKDLYDGLSVSGFVVGPISTDQAKSTAKTMVGRVMDITQKNYTRMAAARAQAQGHVDTLEEYERVKALCPDFHRRKALLYKNALRAKQRAN